jgi:hypothetical protein
VLEDSCKVAAHAADAFTSVDDAVRRAIEELKALTERDAARRQKSVNSGIVFRGPADPRDWDPSTLFTVTQAAVLAPPCQR